MSRTIKEKGITLIALVITIILLLILAGVTLNFALSENGLFSKAQQAVKKYDIASEQEILLQQIMIYQIDNSTGKIGEELTDRKSINDKEWKIIQLNNSKQSYGTNYNYIPKGTNIPDYGNTKYNWVINYKTGEVIYIENYMRLSWDSGISVKDSIALNINPININNENSWGKNVKFVGNDDENSDTSGYNNTEIKFDGVNDYLELDNVKIEKSEGFTFEFYAKLYSNRIYPLEKTYLDSSVEGAEYSSNFRTWFESSTNTFACCFNSGDSGSDIKDSNDKHWMRFKNIGQENENRINYITMTVNFANNEIIIYRDGELKEKTTCFESYLSGSKSLFDETIPFTIGLIEKGSAGNREYTKFDLYACRLYTRVLKSEEIMQNYTETINYHNYLTRSTN